MNISHAVAHMQRAQELLSHGQLQFGSPTESSSYSIFDESNDQPILSKTAILPMQINFDEENQEIQFIKPTFDEINNLFKNHETCSNVSSPYAFERMCLVNLITSGNHNAIFALKWNSLQGIAFLQEVRTRPPGLKFQRFVHLSYPCTIPGRGIGSAMFDYARLQALESNCGLYNRTVEQSHIFWKKMYERLDPSKWIIHHNGTRFWALLEDVDVSEF